MNLLAEKNSQGAVPKFRERIQAPKDQDQSKLPADRYSNLKVRVKTEDQRKREERHKLMEQMEIERQNLLREEKLQWERNGNDLDRFY